MTRLDTEDGLLINTNKRWLSCSSQIALICDSFTDTVLRQTPLLTAAFTFNAEKAVPEFCSKNISVLVQPISELWTTCSLNGEEVQDVVVVEKIGRYLLLPTLLYNANIIRSTCFQLVFSINSYWK